VQELELVVSCLVFSRSSSIRPALAPDSSHEPTTITLSITETRRQLASLLSQIQEHGLQGIGARRGGPVWALLPFRPHGRLCLVLGKHGKPMANLVTVKTW
jgi:antitoxin (DNA-binding transcriptional repressor) of toxin-antitoxin stability system